MVSNLLKIQITWKSIYQFLSFVEEQIRHILVDINRIKTDIYLGMFPEFLKEYLPIIIFLVIALGLSVAFVVINFILSPKNPDPEKLSAYECGFEPFEDSRMEFDVRFYLVAILFIIFDLEIAFLFPWAISLGNIGFLGFISMMIFLFILTIGFIYEWKKGALDWE